MVVAVIGSSALSTSLMLFMLPLLVAVSPVSVLAIPHLTVIPFTPEIICSLILIQFSCG